MLLAGATPGDNSGASVNAAGDVNGDAYGDLLVGANQASPSGRSYAGETYLIYGRPTAPAMQVVGTNGACLASGEAASAAKGTAFRAVTNGVAVTNLFAITNSSPYPLTLGGAATNGAGAAAFQVLGLPAAVAAGTGSNLYLVFSPAAIGTTYTAAVHLANNTATSPVIVNLTGTGGNGLLNQTILFPPLPAQKTTSQVGLAATASSGLPVSFGVLSGPAVIGGGTNLSFTAAGSVAVVASQPGNASWNPAPNVTNSCLVLGDASFSFRAVALTNSVMLRWTDPAEAGLSNRTVLVRYHTDRYPTNTADGTLTYQSEPAEGGSPAPQLNCPWLT